MSIKNAVATIVLVLAAGSASNSIAANLSTVDVSVNGDGSVTSSPAGIDCPDQCLADFLKSETVTLTATPAQGQTFLGWSGACTGVDPVCEIRSNKHQSLTAQFTSYPPPPVAPLAQSGQTSCYDIDGNQVNCAGTGQDGEFQEGRVWPTPRFIVHGDGTTTDTLTGLIWATQNCDTRFWQSALDFVAQLGDGQCGLSDGSVPGDWRMPNVKELTSLLDYGTGSFPAGHPFLNAFNGGYWSSTSDANNTYNAWAVWFGPRSPTVPAVRPVDKSVCCEKILPVRSR